MRAVASAAGVAPGLLHHFFGSKDDLFLAALAVPFDPRAMLAPVPVGPRSEVGLRLATAALAVWEDEKHREPMLAFLRAAMQSPELAAAVRAGIPAIALGVLGDVVTGPDAALRIELAVSQMLGVAIVRYVIAMEPLASLPADELVGRLAPVLQQHLIG
jgi:AcrR family transcriptional regulator